MVTRSFFGPEPWRSSCGSLGRQRLLVFGKVHRLPGAFDDAGPNLRAGLAFAGLFIAVEIFVDANIASRAMFAGEAIEQAGVTLAAVAMAIAGLLIERLLDLGGDGVGILNHEIREKVGVHGRGKRTHRDLRVIGRHRLVGCGLRRIRALGLGQAASRSPQGADSPQSTADEPVPAHHAQVPLAALPAAMTPYPFPHSVVPY